MSGAAAPGQLPLFGPPTSGFTVTERVSRRARSIRIDVRPSGDVVLTIPHRVAPRAAHAFLARQRGWIERTRARLLAQPRAGAAPRLRFDGSDRLPLRGAPMRLLVRVAAGRRSGAHLEGDALVLSVPAARLADHGWLRRVLAGFLAAEAGRDARRLLDEEGARLGLRHAGLTVRDMRSRWGSCGPDGRISLSLRLVMAPPEAFRYVVVHELCHLRWRSHGPRFWALVARQMPDYERHRAWLRRDGEALMRWELRDRA